MMPFQHFSPFLVCDLLDEPFRESMWDGIVVIHKIMSQYFVNIFLQARQLLQSNKESTLSIKCMEVFLQFLIRRQDKKRKNTANISHLSEGRRQNCDKKEHSCWKASHSVYFWNRARACFSVLFLVKWQHLANGAISQWLGSPSTFKLGHTQCGSSSHSAWSGKA